VKSSELFVNVYMFSELFVLSDKEANRNKQLLQVNVMHLRPIEPVLDTHSIIRLID
jgi:hypothetical protein